MVVILIYAAIIIVGVAVAAYLWSDQMRAGPTVLLFAAVACLATASIRFYRDDSQRAVHDQCIGRVERAEGNRVMWLYVIDLLTPNRPEVAADLRAVLDRNVPELHREDCP